MNRRHLLRLAPLAALAACSDPAASSQATSGTTGTKPPAIRTDLTSLTGAEADAPLKRSAKAAASGDGPDSAPATITLP